MSHEPMKRGKEAERGGESEKRKAIRSEVDMTTDLGLFYHFLYFTSHRR